MQKKRIFVLLFLMAFMLPYMVSFVDAQEGNTTFSEGLTIRHEFKNEGLVIETFYITDYINGHWRITDNKNVEIVLRVLNQTQNSTIFMEHMHADCGIFSNESQYVNGLIQDSMDDSIHGMQEGFLVSTKYQYNCVFAIEGYSDLFTEVWGFMVGSYGAISGFRNRLTEGNLVYHGAQGSKFMIVFDLLIKQDNETFYHTLSFEDSFVVYFDGTFVDNPYGTLEEPAYEENNETAETQFFLIVIPGAICAVFIVSIVAASLMKR